MQVLKADTSDSQTRQYQANDVQINDLRSLAHPGKRSRLSPALLESGTWQYPRLQATNVDVYAAKNQLRYRLRLVTGSSSDEDLAQVHRQATAKTITGRQSSL